MTGARRALIVLSWLYVLGVVVQFFLAGLGTLGGESMSAHEGFGWSALHLTPILILIVAFVAKVSRTTLLFGVALAIVSFAQPFWVTEFRDETLGSLHVVGALVLFVLAHHLAQRAMHET